MMAQSLFVEFDLVLTNCNCTRLCVLCVQDWRLSSNQNNPLQLFPFYSDEE